ncbi:hypothetical protein MN608_05381 [Microdochium nivale]|nr:hypothetical protein MN608_05381 [Microdochium nivale]
MTMDVLNNHAGTAPASAPLKQKVSILVVRGQPRDTQDTRATKLCVSHQLPGMAVVNHIFELAGTRPTLKIRQSSASTPLSSDPHVVRNIEVATISTTAEQKDALLAALRTMSVSSEWDHRNWLDEVLKRLKVSWPIDFADDAVEPLINHATDLILKAPKG